jgi:hypothetical protein
MNKAQLFLSFCEDYTVTVALHNPGSPEQKDYYVNTHIFNFELWDVPSDDPIVSGNKLAKNYVGLFNNLTTIVKKDIRKYNSTKQRISIELDTASKIFIPDNVWNQLKIVKPKRDQKLFLQCLSILYKQYKVRIMGMEDSSNIENFWG